MDFSPHKKTSVPIKTKDFLKFEPAIKKLCLQYPVSLLYLHGSLALDKHQALSDIDLAVLFENDKPDYNKLSQLSSHLSEIIGQDIDLGLLNTGSPLFCMQVLHKGKELYSKSEANLIAFRKRTIDNYLRTNHLRDQFYENLNESILKG